MQMKIDLFPTYILKPQVSLTPSIYLRFAFKKKSCNLKIDPENQTFTNEKTQNSGTNCIYYLD